MQVAQVDQEKIQAFLDREWKSVDESVFGGHDPRMWDVQRYALAAYDGDRIAGAVLFKIEAGLGKLSQIVVAAGQRGQGIGAALLATFEETCRREGCHKLGLKTFWNSEAPRFYQRHGYVVEAILRRDVGGVDMCQMYKFL